MHVVLRQRMHSYQFTALCAVKEIPISGGTHCTLIGWKDSFPKCTMYNVQCTMYKFSYLLTDTSSDLNPHTPPVIRHPDAVITCIIR